MVFRSDGCSFLYAPKIDLDKNSDEKIGNLEEDDLSIDIANHSQRIFALSQSNNFSNFQCVMS